MDQGEMEMIVSARTLLAGLLTAAVLTAPVLTGCGGGKEHRADQVSYHYSLGRASLQDRNYQAALLEFYKSLDINADDTRTLYAVGHTFFLLQDYPKSMEYMQHVLRLDPGNGDAINYLGNIYEKLGRDTDAVAMFEKAAALRTYATPHFALHNMARIYLKRGDTKKAESLLQDVLRRVPEYAPGIADLGRLYLDQHRWDKAIVQWDVFVKVAPAVPEGHYFLAEAYTGQGNNPAAVLALNEFFHLAEDSHPLYPDANALRARLGMPR
ncbi:MAG: tetratricopeptide repeat protein [Nitrospirota bacterium]|nr:tetratricopeptide repeat protein [Nitrospirota bacterium]